MTTQTTTALFVVVENPIYLAWGIGIHIHTFSTVEARDRYIARSPETRRAITEQEARALSRECRHYSLHEDTMNDREVVHMAYTATDSVTYITHERGEYEPFVIV